MTPDGPRFGQGWFLPSVTLWLQTPLQWTNSPERGRFLFACLLDLKFDNVAVFDDIFLSFCSNPTLFPRDTV